MVRIVGYIYCAIATFVVIAGDYFLKTAADRSLSLDSPLFVIGCGLYAASAIGWYLAMRHIMLSQIGVTFSMFTLLALCAMGVMFFDEKLDVREYFGIVLALISLLLMARIV